MQFMIWSLATCPTFYYATLPSSFGVRHNHHLSSKASRFVLSFWLLYICSLFLEGFSLAVFMVAPFITFRAQLKCHLLLPNHTICTLFFSCTGLIPDLIIVSLLYHVSPRLDCKLPGQGGECSRTLRCLSSAWHSSWHIGRAQ